MTLEEKNDCDKCQLLEFLHFMRSVFEKANEQDGGGNYTPYKALGEVIKKCWIEWREGGEKREECVMNVGVQFILTNHCKNMDHKHKG